MAHRNSWFTLLYLFKMVSFHSYQIVFCMFTRGYLLRPATLPHSSPNTSPALDLAEILHWFLEWPGWQLARLDFFEMSLVISTISLSISRWISEYLNNFQCDVVKCSWLYLIISTWISQWLATVVVNPATVAFFTQAMILCSCSSLELNCSWPMCGTFEKWWCQVTFQKNNIAMENHHVQWENPLFLWPFSIAMLNYQRVHSKKKIPSGKLTVRPWQSSGLVQISETIKTRLFSGSNC